jgi:hypothetical protein
MDDLVRMMVKQHCVCAICQGTFEDTPCVDHCHASDKVRGLLCHACNKMLGFARDNAEVLRTAAAYLDKAAGVTQDKNRDEVDHD